MNKQQIKAELRRSACEDRFPVIGVSNETWNFLLFDGWRKFGSDFQSRDTWRIFFLLVAEAL